MAKIYLHWTATAYDWVRSGIYHTIVSGDGKLHRMHDYSMDLPAHTYQRNHSSIGISCACMGGEPDPWSLPPTPAQLEAMCQEVARVAKVWGWTQEQITIQHILTHAEAASNQDGWIAHENYGPVAWGGTGERWDFMQLTANGADNAGDVLRRKILGYFQGSTATNAAPSDIANSNSQATHALTFKRDSTIEANGETLETLIDEKGSSWAKVERLLSLYDLSYQLILDQQKVLIGNSDIAPKYLTDQVQPDVGYSLFEMSLQGQNSPVILIGIMRDGIPYCKVYEFAQELGITTTFNPFQLGRRLGG